MMILGRALVAASCVASALAVDIVVQSTGGNVTGKFGIPYGYGFLHEVREH
jgi:alpha-N-arabinofuranosidase